MIAESAVEDEVLSGGVDLTLDSPSMTLQTFQIKDEDPILSL